MSTPANETQFTDIVVAVHGIGQQVRYSTVRSVANRLAVSHILRGDSKFRPAAPQPLGYFHGAIKGLTSIVRVDDPTDPASALSRVGLAEVFWADIPEKAVKEGSTLEETKAWGRTVVARAQAIWTRSTHADLDKQPVGNAITPDFSLAGEVLDEIIETIYVLENLLYLTEKAGLFKFDLREVLEDYLGDVQIVAEFANYREEILLTFHSAMQNIYDQQREKNPEVRLHIVAHSEGTVVSFLGLLQAMSGMRVMRSGTAETPKFNLERSGSAPDWLSHVHGYMTIGSPIDKHLLLWPRMWPDRKPATLAINVPGKDQIKWRNYYDYGDPIGFKLDTVRERLAEWNIESFEFRDEHDHGFARYLLPGKAHNDYWDDPDVFEHFIKDVRIGTSSIATPADAKPPPPPPTRKAIYVLSPALPYILSFGLLLAGVYLLDKAVLDFTYPFGDPLVRHLLIAEIGVEPTAIDPRLVFINTLGISALIAGTTLLARIPRLAGGKRWLAAGFLAFATGCAIFAWLVEGIGGTFAFLGKYGPMMIMCLTALIVALTGLWVAKRNKDPDHDRRRRWVRRGMRPLILCGAAAITAFVGLELFPLPCTQKIAIPPGKSLTKEQLAIVQKAGFDENEVKQLFDANKIHNLEKVKPLLTARPPIWPVMLAGAVFLYLWWLAALLFDLAFVWQRYVRGSLANDHLMLWTRNKKPLPAEKATGSAAG